MTAAGIILIVVGVLIGFIGIPTMAGIEGERDRKAIFSDKPREKELWYITVPVLFGSAILIALGVTLVAR